MTIKITWRTRGDLEVLYLGEIPVGRVAPDGGRNNRPRWLFNLDGAASIWRDAKTIVEARVCVLLALDQWLNRAGLQ